MVKAKQLGSRLREERAARGWSREKLAVELDSTYAAVKVWEEGRGLPRLGVFGKMVELFGWDDVDEDHPSDPPVIMELFAVDQREKVDTTSRAESNRPKRKERVVAKKAA